MKRVAYWLLAVLLGSSASWAAGPGGENAVDFSSFATKEALSAIQLQVPAASTATPPATALDSVQGGSTAYARADHTHAARVQRATMMTDASGNATFTFARPIICVAGRVPPIAYMVEDTGTPVVVQITSRTFTSDGTNDTHTAVTVKAQRSRTLPATLLSLNALLNFDLFSGVAASVRVNLFAADPTQ